MVGGWTCVVRFACHIPMGMVAFGGRNLYSSVKDLADTGLYDVIPNGHTFLSGLQMYSTWGVFAFSWNFVMFLGCFGAFSWLLLLLAIGDLLVAAPLMASAIKQAQFAPRTYAACSGAADWRNGTDGRNFFIEAQWEMWGTYGTAEGMCKSFLETWATTVAMVVLYGLMGIINVAFFVILEHSDRKSRARYSPNNKKNIFVRFGTTAWELIVLVTGPVRWVLDYPLAVIRLFVRYVIKKFGGWKRAWDHRRAGKEREKASNTEYAVDKELDIGEPPVLPLEILRLIAQDVHFADLVSASRASKTLRAGLFGTVDVPAVLKDVQATTCHRQQKEDCKLCGIQVCIVCQQGTRVATSLAQKHTAACRPHCTACYFKTTCRGLARRAGRAQWAAKHRPPCSLAPQPDGDIEMGAMASGGGDVKMLCRLCVALEPEERTRRFGVKDGERLESRGRKPMACGNCSVALPKGTMWWVCRGCFTECPSHLHPTGVGE